MTVLRGPLDPERFRVMYRCSRHYIDPLPADGDIVINAHDGKDDRLPSFSKIKGTVHKKSFRKRYAGQGPFDLDGIRAGQYVAAHREHLLQLDDRGVVSTVAQAAGWALTEAADRGTDVHLLIEWRLLGRPYDLNDVEVYAPKAVPYLDVIEKLWAEQNPRPMFSEVVGMNWEHGYAATADGLGVQFNSLPGLMATDWKTRGADSNHSAYETEAMQVAAAANVEYVFVQDEETGEVKRLVPPLMDGGVIVSIKPDSYELYPIDLDTAWDAWVRTLDAYHAKQTSESLGRKAVGKPVFVQPTTISSEGHSAPEAAAPVVEAAATPSDDPFAGLPDSDGEHAFDRARKTEFLTARAAELLAAGHGAVLVEHWPADVPGFKVMREAGELHSNSDLLRIEEAIWAAEKETAMPFPDDDPSVPEDKLIDPNDDRVKDAGLLWRALPDDLRPDLPSPKLSSGNAKESALKAFELALDDANAKMALRLDPIVDITGRLMAKGFSLVPIAAALHDEVISRPRPEDPERVVLIGEALLKGHLLSNGETILANAGALGDRYKTNADLLKAGREQAKLLGLDTPRKADDVKASPLLVAAVMA